MNSTLDILDPPEVADLHAKASSLVEEVNVIAKAAETAGRDFNADERATIKAKLDEAKGYTDRAKSIKADHRKNLGLKDDIAALTDDLGLIADAHPTSVGKRGPDGRAKSLGERFVEDAGFKAWHDRLAPTGHIPDSAKGITSPPVGFRGLKDIVTGGSDASAGALVATDYRGLLDEGALRAPLVMRDLITVGTTGSDTVEYARVVGETSNAAIVPEASGTSAGDATADVTGEKPESDMELERVTETVKTIAHWIPATKRALSDAGQIRTLIDAFLRFGLDEELEDQIVNGDGTGDNFEGILEVDGHQTQAWDTDILVTTRKAKTKVRTVGRTIANAYVLNPADNERIDLTKDDNGGFYFGGPAGAGVNTLWGLPRVESEAVPEGVGICGNFRMAVLWDREQAAISVSDSHNDFFVRNLVAILAELRAAFGVLRPKAFVEIDLTA